MTSPTIHPPGVGRSRTGSRQLYRSRHDRVLFGVCGGLGRYLAIDPVLLRILTVVLVFAGVGLVAYVVAWLLIPEEPADAPVASADPETRHRVVVILGAVLVAVGGLMVLRSFMPWMHSALFWPLLVIGGGILLIVSARR